MISNNDFSTSILNVSNSDIEKSSVVTSDDTVVFDITLKRKPMTCPLCRGTMIGHGQKIKTINHPVYRGHKCFIRYHANRYICKDCGKTAFENNPFTLSGFNSSFFLIQNAFKLLSNLNYNLKMISEQLNISTTQLSRYIDSYIVIPKRQLPECLGIDEIHSRELSRRNASYLCILVDNANRNIYDVLDTRSKMALSLYFSNISREDRLKVKYVTIDMWEPYRDVAKTYFPNCKVAVDPFHVVEHLQRDFELLRINIMNNTQYGSNSYYLLKKWNWLLVKDNVYMDNEKVFNSRFNAYLNRRDILEMIKSTFPTLATAYDLKEYYRKFNKESSYDDAVLQYDKIIDEFKKANIKQYEEFTNILINWKEEILNSFLRPYDRKLSNSYTENINGQIRTYMSVSKGICNFERFRKRVIYALSDDVTYAITKELTSVKYPSKERGKYNKVHE